MTPRERPEFLKVLSDLAELFGRELKPSVVDLYWDALKDLALSTVQAMAKSHARGGRFFPKPLELRPVEQRALPVVVLSEEFKAGEKRANARLDELWHFDRVEWLRQVGPRVRELGLAKGMLLGEIEQKLQSYRPRSARG